MSDEQHNRSKLRVEDLAPTARAALAEAFAVLLEVAGADGEKQAHTGAAKEEQEDMGTSGHKP